jgi:hypothetical protein
MHTLVAVLREWAEWITKSIKPYKIKALAFARAFILY